MSPFGVSRRQQRRYHRQAMDMRHYVRHHGEKVHDRRWMFVALALIVVIVLVYVH